MAVNMESEEASEEVSENGVVIGAAWRIFEGVNSSLLDAMADVNF